MRRLDASLPFLFAVLCMLLTPCLASGQRADPETGQVRILYIGDGWGPSPVPLYRSDPAFTIVSVPTSELHVGHGVTTFDNLAMRKFVRLYMPRTYEHMIGENDVTILSDANRLLMGNNQIEWFRRSVTEEGLGLIMVGGLESFGAPRGEPWTDIEDVLPVGLIPGSWIYRSFKPKPAVDHPFTSSLPWNSIPYFHGTNMVALKQESTLLLKADEIKYPPLSYADFGRGRSIAHSSDWTPGGGTDVMRWEYYLDYVANIAYLGTGNDIPQDARLLHQLRTSFWSTRSRLTSVVDTLNFAERFGANTNKVERKLEGVRQTVSDAERLYILQEYSASREKIDEIDEMIVQLHEEAIGLKDATLLWVYVIEWAVTAGTALLAALLLWTLMVKRRLYRDVKATRMVSLER